MTWNYRIIKNFHKESNETSYQIHEVYYDSKGGIETWTEKAVEPFGQSEELRYIMQAFYQSVLEEKLEKGKAVLYSEEKNESINEGDFFELMDRSSVTADYIYQFLGCHPLLKSENNLIELYKRAEDALLELYQEVGELAFKRSD